MKLFFPDYYKLLAAIDLLCEVHTRPDPDIGFVVMMGATPRFGQQIWYNDSWETLIETVGKWQSE